MYYVMIYANELNRVSCTAGYGIRNVFFIVLVCLLCDSGGVIEKGAKTAIARKR